MASTTLAERINEFTAFQQKVNWIPLTSTSKLKQYNLYDNNGTNNTTPNGNETTNGNDSFVLFLHSSCKYRLPNTALPLGYTNPRAKLALQYHVSLYDNTSLAFFGRTYVSPRLLPIERTVTDGNVWETKEGDIVYWLNSINNDNNLYIIIEPVLCLLDIQYNIVQSISLGWSILNPFSSSSVTSGTGPNNSPVPNSSPSSSNIPFWTTNSVQQIENSTNRMTIPVYTGTPRVLFISPINSSTSLPPTVQTSSTSYSLFRYPVLRSIQHLLRFNTLFGPLDNIPGLKPNRIRKQIYQPLTYTDALIDNSPTLSLACLAPSSTDLYMVPQIPQLPLTLGITINNLLTCIPPGLENNIVRTLIINREIELGIKPGSIPPSMFQIRNRFLHISIHNGYTNVHTSTIEIFRSNGNHTYGSLAVPGSTLYETDNEVYLSGYVPHEYMAILFRLEYIINEPTGTALGLKVAKQLQLQANITMDNSANTETLNNFTNNMATSIVTNGTALEQRKRVLVGHRIYIPYQTNNLVFANRRKQGLGIENSVNQINYPLSFTCRSFELPLDAPNPFIMNTILPLDGRLQDLGNVKDGINHTPLDKTNQFILGMDIDVAVEKRKPVVTISTPSTMATTTNGTNDNNNDNNFNNGSVSGASSESVQSNGYNNSRSDNMDTSYDNARSNNARSGGSSSQSVLSSPSSFNRKDDRKISFAQDTSFRNSDDYEDNNTSRVSNRSTNVSLSNNQKSGTNNGSNSNVSSNYTDQPQPSRSLNNSYRYNDDSGYDSPESIGEDIDDYHDIPSSHNTSTLHHQSSRPNVLEELLALSVVAPTDRFHPYSSSLSTTVGNGVPPPVIIPGTNTLGLSTVNQPNYTTNIQATLPSAYDYLVPFDKYPIAYSSYGSSLLPSEQNYLRNQVGLPSLLVNGNNNYNDRLNIIINTPLYRTIHTELSDPLSVNLLTFTFIAYTPNIRSTLITSTSGVPKKLSFALQFYSSPYIRTETVTLQDISSTSSNPNGSTKALSSSVVSTAQEDNSTRLYLLSGPSGSMGSSMNYQVTSFGEKLSFLSVRIRIAPRNDEDRLSFIHYIATKALTIEVWDAESLLPIGNASIHLSQFLRQQAQYTSQPLSCDIVSPLGLDYPVSSNPNTGGDNTSPAVLGLPSSHSNTYVGLNSGVVVGRLLVLGNCIGQKAVISSSVSHPVSSTVPTKTNNVTVPSSSAMVSTAATSKAINNSTGGRQARVRVIAKPLNNETNKGMTHVQGAGRYMDSSVTPLTATVDNTVPSSEIIPAKIDTELLNRQLTTIPTSFDPPSKILHDSENETLSRQVELSTVQNYRNDVRGTVITEHLRALSTATYTFSSSYGTSKYMELTIRNPSLYPDTVTVKVLDDANNEVRIITNIHEWNYLRTTLPLVCPDAGLTSSGNQPVKDYNWKLVSSSSLQVSLGSEESMTIPILYTPSVASADIRWSSKDAAGLSVAMSMVPATDAWKSTQGETLDSYFTASATDGYTNVSDMVRHIQIHVSATAVSEPLALLHIQPTLRPFPIHRTVRYFHNEVSYLRGSIPLPTVPLPLAAASYMNPIPSMNPSIYTSNNTAYLAAPSVVSHDPMVLLQLVDDGYGGKEIMFRYKTGIFPSTSTFYLHIYADPYNAVLVETWRIVIHSVLAVDIHSVIGQQTNLDLVVRGAPFSRQARIYGTSNDIINTIFTKLPDNNITLVPNALTRVPLSLRPLRSTLNPHTNTILPRPMFISLVENSSESPLVSHTTLSPLGSSVPNNLICLWYVGVTLSPSHVSRIYDISIPLGTQFIQKKLSYVNAWGRSRTVGFAVSHPQLVSIPSSLTLEAYRTEALSLKFTPLNREAQEMVYIYVEDETGTLEDTFLLRILYSANVKLSTKTTVKNAGTVKLRYRDGITNSSSSNNNNTLNQSFLNRSTTNENILSTSMISPVKTEKLLMKQL